MTPNGKDIGVGTYGKVFEVEFCGKVYAAKEIHSNLVQGVRREEFEATKKAFMIMIMIKLLGQTELI